MNPLSNFTQALEKLLGDDDCEPASGVYASRPTAYGIPVVFPSSSTPRVNSLEGGVLLMGTPVFPKFLFVSTNLPPEAGATPVRKTDLYIHMADLPRELAELVAKTLKESK